LEVRNVHERLLPAPPSQVGLLLDSLADPSDQLWPGDRWPAMRFDRPLSVGAVGGHGPIRYRIEHYEPARMIRFRFTRPRGFGGTHGFLVEAEAGGTLLRHELVMHVSGFARLTWPLVFRPLHDALIEDALDRASAALGQSVSVRRWPVRVRVLRALLKPRRSRKRRTAAA
jgi:hypothetical protein